MSARIPREISDPQASLLAAFHASDVRGQQSVPAYALSTAEDWSAPRPKGSTPSRIDLLISGASKISAMLVAASSLRGDERAKLLLDCSSKADDFARDLDALVGSPS